MSDGKLSELEQRLQAAKEQRARIEQERFARAPELALLEQVEAEELAAKNAQAIADAEAAHGPMGKKVRAIETSNGVVIVKRPNHLLFRKFQDSGKVSTDECERLVRPCLVYPDAATFDRWAEEEPGIIVRAANACAQLAGIRAEEVAGK